MSIRLKMYILILESSFFYLVCLLLCLLYGRRQIIRGEKKQLTPWLNSQELQHTFNSLNRDLYITNLNNQSHHLVVKASRFIQSHIICQDSKQLHVFILVLRAVTASQQCDCMSHRQYSQEFLLRLPDCDLPYYIGI